jgi:hypothetical protein
MNSTCPAKVEWLNLLDGEATENRAAELRAHASDCPRCAQELELQRQLLRDLAAPVPVAANAVQSVMRRLEKSERPPRRLGWRGWTIAAGTLAAAAVVTFLVLPRTGVDGGVFSARGHKIPWTQKVGVEVWALESSPRKLTAGATLSPRAAIVASYHNVDAAMAYLLLFAIDARGEVHWAYPGFENPKTDPEAVRLEALQMKKVLPDSVLFENLPAGSLEIVTLVSREPLSVSRIESLSAPDRSVASLHARFPSARIEGLSLRVVPDQAVSNNKERP